MAADIIIDQAAKPPGVAGKAREDLDVGTDVTLTAAGGPFSAHLWSIKDKPVDIITPAQSAAVLTTPTASATVATPIDLEGSYLVELLVDSGQGLGATADDVARITFYANTVANPLAADPAEFPRRRPAFLEQAEHNVDGPLFGGPAGNPRGWAQEWERWFAAINRMALAKSFSWGRVVLPPLGPASLPVGGLGAFNVASVARTGLGTVDVVFARPALNADYVVIPTARGAVGGSCTVTAEALAGFTVSRANPGGALVDADFNFEVHHRPV